MEDLFDKLYGTNGVKVEYERKSSKCEKLEKELTKLEEKKMHALDIMNQHPQSSQEYIDADNDYKDADREVNNKNAQLLQLQAEISNIRTQIEDIIEILAKDKTVNKEMVEQLRSVYTARIQDVAETQDNCLECNSLIIASVLGREAGNRELADLFEQARNNTSNRTAFDLKCADIKLKINEIAKQKFKLSEDINIEQSEIESILQMSETDLEKYKINELEHRIDDAHSILTSLEDARDKKVSEFEKKVEHNISPQDLATIQAKEGEISRIDTDISTKQGEPNYKSIAPLINRLMANNIIMPETMVLQLQNKQSDVSKAYENFVSASEKVRIAFKAVKINPKDDNITNVKNACREYELCCAEMARLTGFGSEAWQNYLNNEIDEGKRSIDGKEELYYLEKQDIGLNSLASHEKIQNITSIASQEYDRLVNQTKDINEGQSIILKNGGITQEAGDKLKCLFDSNSADNYSKTIDKLFSEGVLAKKALEGSLINKGKKKGIFASFRSNVGGFFSRISRIFRRGKKEAKRLLANFKPIQKALIKRYNEKSDDEKNAYIDVQKLKDKRSKLREEITNIRDNSPLQGAPVIEQTNIEEKVNARKKEFGELGEYWADR